MRAIKELCDDGNAKRAVERMARIAKRFMPVTSWAPRMNASLAISDCTGGFIAGVMIVPTCLSWASLAGLDLSCGLSAAFFASLSYGTFGSCAVLSIGPVAEITTLLISISGIAPEKREQTFQSIGVQVGILSVLLSFIDGGKVIKTIFAKPVGDGYTCAAALLAICVQLKTMFNVTAPPATLIQDVLYQTIKALIQQFSIKSIYCFLLFMTYCLYLIYIKKTSLPIWIPHQLIVVVVSTLVTYYFELYSEDSLHLSIVGNIPPGLKRPSFPPWENIIGLGPYTLTITMISFVQMYVIAQRVMPDINPNGELFASGVTNFLCNVMGGMPVTNSFSVSSVLMEQHVNTPLTAYTAATVVFITMMALTRLGVFYYLPKQALGSIVVASVWRLVDFSSPTRLWHYSKKDMGVWIFTFVLTIFGGITVGVLGGIALSLILVVLRVARPRAVTVGFNMSTFRYGDISRDPELLVYPNILLWRFDAPLYFVNVGYFQEKLIKAVRAEVRPIDVVLVTCGKIVDIDAAALGALPVMIESIATADKARPRRIILCDIHGRLEQVLHASEALPMYVPDEYDRLTIEQIENTGKFPVVFKKLEDAISFAQRCISERYGNVDTAPYPNVSFLTDLVVEAAKLQDSAGSSALATLASAHSEEGEVGAEASLSFTSPTMDLALRRHDSDRGASPHGSRGPGGATDEATRHMSIHLLQALEKLKKLSSYSPDRELIGMVGLIRNTEVTPRQKEKILFTERALIAHAFKSDAALQESKRSLEDLEDLFHAVDELLRAGRLTHAESWRRVLAIARSDPPGLKMKVKAQPIFYSRDASFASLDVRQQMQLEPHCVEDVQAARFVLKWGGVPTRSGIAQAHVLGEKLFARFFAAGDLPMRRLLAFTRHPTVRASDDTRVISTALVVTNAITQSGMVAKDDIILDDDLLKSLNPTAKRLLHDEYKYFEALMHIDAHAAARHYFHIPGFRQLLLIPLLDRPLRIGGHAGDDMTEGHGELSNGGFSGALGNPSGLPSHMPPPGVHNEWDSFDPMAGSNPSATDISFVHGSRAATNQNAFAGIRKQQQSTLANSDYYTPLDVMQELERNLRIIAEAPLPHHVLSLPLSNLETIREMRLRYGGMLKVFLGSKRRQNMSTREAVAARRLRREQGGSVTDPSLPHARGGGARVEDEGGEGEEDTYEVDDGNGSSEGSHGVLGQPESGRGQMGGVSSQGGGPRVEKGLDGARSRRGGGGDGHDDSSDEGDSDNSTGEDENVMSDVAAPPSGDAPLNGCGSEASSSGPTGARPLAYSDGSGSRVEHGGRQRQQQQQQQQLPSSHAQQTSGGHGGGGDRRLGSQADSHGRPPTASQDTFSLRSEGLPTGPSTPPPQPCATAAGGSPTARHPPDFAPRLRQPPRYDLSDISKLRDYGSYDMSYNMHILRGLHAVTHMPAVRRLIEALARVARITEGMSRVGENVLEGVNSSKRFIIGSLVSGGLLKSIFRDYNDFAKLDERKGVKELLFRAQSLYMAENGGVEQDVQHVVRLFRKFSERATGSGSAKKKKTVTFEPIRGDEPQLDETPAEREFRLKFPFISLPKEEEISTRKDSGNSRRRSTSPSSNAAGRARRSHSGAPGGATESEEDVSYARFYFTTYLHVEGALQCFFESNTVEGFSRPSKEELEASQQLYMKHLIFKVFRRRNYSFTDAEGLAAFRKLHLLFRSDVDYGRQQRELRAALANIYHCMYYISMEVYLSLGDSDALGGADEAEGPLLVIDGELDPGAGGGLDGGLFPAFAAESLRWEDRRAGSRSNPSTSASDDEDGDESEEELPEMTRLGSLRGSTGGSPSRRRRSGGGPTATGRDDALPIISVTPSSPSRAATSVSTVGPGAARHMGTPSALGATLGGSGGGGSPPSSHVNRSLLALHGSVRNLSVLSSSPTAQQQQQQQRGYVFSPSSLLPTNATFAGAAGGDRSSPIGSPLVSAGADTAAAASASPVVAVAVSSEPSLAVLQPPPKKRTKHRHSAKKAATVLKTPEAGRSTAAVQEMKNRVSSVTPMRRVHEGISIDDFARLIREAESAILSQQSGC